MSQNLNIAVLRLKELQGAESVSAFARRLEMPHRTLDSYLKGERKLSLDLAFRVCAKCGVSADWLLGLTDQRSPFIEAPRENKVSKTPEIREKFPSFGRPVCRSVRQYYKDTTNGAEKQEQKGPRR